MAQQALALAASIEALAAPDRLTIFHLMHSALGMDMRAALAKLERPGFECFMHPVGSDFDYLPIQAPFSSAIYFRLMIPQALAGVDKAVYLDADTIALRDVAELFDENVDNVALAAMPDYAMYYFELMSGVPVSGKQKPVFVYMREKLGISYSQPSDYFNSGVMTMNLKAWRERNIGAECLRYIARRGRLQWPDQDSLNVVCGGDYARIDARWNAFARWCNGVSKFGRSPDFDALQHAWTRDPWIVHFSGDCKPWIASHSRTIHDTVYWRHHKPWLATGSTDFQRVEPVFIS